MSQPSAPSCPHCAAIADPTKTVVVMEFGAGFSGRATIRITPHGAVQVEQRSDPPPNSPAPEGDEA